MKQALRSPRRAFCMLLERMIMVTAMIIRRMPMARLNVNGSPKTSTPTKTAVTGSIAPNTAVSVPPILWTASTRVIFEMTVGTIARSIRLTSDIVSGIGCIPSLVLALMENRMVLTMNT